MNKNKLIISYSPNFYKIINYEYPVEDEISCKIIKIYERYIFGIDPNNKKDIEIVKMLDKILYKYMNDYNFRKVMKKDIFEIKVSKSKDLVKSIVLGIIKIYEKFEDGITRNIYVSRWI